MIVIGGACVRAPVCVIRRQKAWVVPFGDGSYDAFARVDLTSVSWALAARPRLPSYTHALVLFMW